MKKGRIVLLLIALLALTMVLCSCMGKQGPQGEVGPQGPQGPQGEVGPQGPQGVAGEQGPQGADGKDGTNGVDGEPGAAGKSAEYRAKDGWVQWKYTDEDDSSWRDLYQYYYTVTDENDPIPDWVPSSYVTTYSDSDDYGLAGTYTMLDGVEYEVGDTVTLNATVNSGYNFEGWFISDYYDETCLSNELSFEYTVTSYDVDVEARFSNYKINVVSYTDDMGLAGTYTMIANKKISVGDQVALTATVNDGYTFDGWYNEDTGACISHSLTHTFTMGAQNANLEARFSAYTLTTGTYNNVANVAGTYTKYNQQKIAVGQTVDLEATVNEGYNFEGWYIDDVCVSKALKYSYTMEREDVEIYAMYSGYTLTTIGRTEGENAFNAGTITQYTNEFISAGTSITLVATVNEGYNFVGWFVDDVCVSTDLEYTNTMIKADVVVEAVYCYYTLSTTARNVQHVWQEHVEFSNPELYISIVYDNQRISVGQSITVTAEDIDGFTFDCWRTPDAVLSRDKTCTFNMPSSNVELYALYYPIEE